MGPTGKTDSPDKGKTQGQRWREAGQTRVPSSLPWKQLDSAVTSTPQQSALSAVGLVQEQRWPHVGLGCDFLVSSRPPVPLWPLLCLLLLHGTHVPDGLSWQVFETCFSIL